MNEFWRTLPKVELHLHLDCGLSYDVVRQLQPTMRLAQYQEDFVAPPKCTDLVDFLQRVPPALVLMQTEAQLALVVQDLFTQLQADNVLYAEVRFAPHLHTERGLDITAVTEIVESALRQRSETSGVTARLLLCTLRHFDVDQSMAVAQLVKRFRGSYVVGLDIAGDEAGHPIEAHLPAFRYANGEGIPCTAHAGEACGAGSVWETLTQLMPKRIGHGVRSIEDGALLAHLRRHHIHLEVCPTCNVQTDVCDRYEDHPIDELYKAGISLSINTDGRTVSDIDLNEEYGRLQEIFGWHKVHFWRCNRDALQAAFVAEDVKERLLSQLAQGYGVI